MNEWRTMVLKNCISVIETGKREKGGAVSVGIPSIGAEHLQKDGRINWAESSMKYVSAVFFEAMKTGKLQPDDVLLVKDGATTGKVAYVDTVPAQGAAINEHIFLMRPKEDLLPKYLYFYLYSPIGKNNVLRFFKGAAIGGISRDFLNAEIKMPPISMQKDIVGKLSYIDESIDVCQAILDKTEELVKSRFIEMFGDPLANPYGIPVVKLSELSSLITKGASPKWQGFTYSDDITQTLFVTSENVREGFLDLSEPKYVEDSFNDKQKRSMLLKGDVLINIVGASIGRAAKFDIEQKANINQAVALVRVNDEVINLDYLLRYLNSEKALQMYDSMKSDVARANLSLQDIGNLDILVPPRDEQNRYADFVALTDKSELVIRELLEKHQLMKEALMQEYFG